MDEKTFGEYGKLFVAAGKLKKVVRAGWGKRGVPNAESVADHSYRMSLMACVLAERLGADAAKLTAMCLLHDLAESEVGDITPADGISPEEKRAREETAFRSLLNGVPCEDFFITLWLEYEEGRTKESRAARFLDKLEMALQATEYQSDYPHLDLSEFLESAEEMLRDSEFKDLF